ncbi:MAG TPA: DUF459 domain-containing protein [Treponemataceae bacterium]|nr:DUF459 domain-containing protein [Treponemataceae bacterium]
MFALRKKDAYSTNEVMITVILISLFLIIFCGKSLWVPASRIKNLYVRAIVLSLTDAGSSFASSTKLDLWVPFIREKYLSFTGLSTHSSWDTRYFNRRNTTDAPLLPLYQDKPIASHEIIIPKTENPEATLDETKEVVSKTFSSNSPRSLIHSLENPLQVYMFGDSQVFSLGSGLSRLAGKNSPIDVDFLAIHSSGFIRGDYYNWPLKLADTLSEVPYDAVVMMLGMNDWQSFWNNKGEILKKGSPEWIEAYKDKCRTLIDLVLLHAPRLYWIGMPIVNNPIYAESLSFIDSVQEYLAAEYSPNLVTRISLKNPFNFSKTPTEKPNEFISTIEYGGKQLVVMGGDGSHFTVEGGQFAMLPLFNRLSSDFMFSIMPVASLP